MVKIIVNYVMEHPPDVVREFITQGCREDEDALEKFGVNVTMLQRQFFMDMLWMKWDGNSTELEKAIFIKLDSEKRDKFMEKFRDDQDVLNSSNINSIEFDDESRQKQMDARRSFMGDQLRKLKAQWESSQKKLSGDRAAQMKEQIDSALEEMKAYGMEKRTLQAGFTFSVPKAAAPDNGKNGAAVNGLDEL